MFEKLKKTYLFQNKKAFLVFLFSVFLGSFLPLKLVSAGWVSYIASVVAFVPALFFAFFLSFAAAISAALSGLSASFLAVVTNPGMMRGLSYTNPNRNPLIATGLGITQSFVNIILVLVLVYIAIATILRLAGYETRKILVTFVIIALLVNFAPVITGLIVDASNIVMYYFLKNIGGYTNWINIQTSWTNTFRGDLGPWSIASATLTSELAFRLLAITVLNTGLALFLFLFAFLFLARYIAIWILVILSPLAFACYILPRTRQWAEMWWKQLIQWSIIGITGAFFLYLAEQTIGIDIVVPPGALFTAVLPQLLPLGFLFIALIFGLQTSAIGASIVMSTTKKYGAATGKWTAKQTIGRALSTKTGQKVSSVMAKTKFGIPKPGEVKGIWKKIGAGAAHTAAAPFYWATRTAGKAGLEYGASQEKSIGAEKKKIEETFTKNQYKEAAATYSAILPGEYQKKIAMGRFLKEAKGGKAFEELTKEQQKEIIKLTAKYSPDDLEDLIKLNPTLIDDAEIGAAVLKVKPEWSSPEAIVENMKPNDYKNISEEALDDIRVISTMIENATGSHISQLIESHGKAAADAIKNSLTNITTTAGVSSEEYLETYNKPLLKYLTKGAGIGLIDVDIGP